MTREKCAGLVDVARSSPYKGSVLGRRIEERLAELGMTQADLAIRLGVYQQTVSKWIKGETTPRPKRLRSIEQLLELDAGELLAVAFDEDHDPPPAAAPTARPTRYAVLDRRLTVLEEKMDELLARLPPAEGSR